jgi:DNA-binding SARP family transcriptional activator
MLKVKLFGPGQASYRDRPLSGFPQQQNWLLLCYLLLNRQHPQNRERLAAVFWGDQPAQIARKNLRNMLWRMRQMLTVSGAQPDEYFLISETSIAFITHAPYWLDVELFESAAPYIHLSNSELLEPQVAALETAVELYQGDLLENIYEDWCLYERERLRLLYVDMLHRLLGYHTSRGSYATGLQYGERILACESTREDVHRQMMWMYAQSGNRAAALAQYKRCRQILQQELNVHPAESTTRLYEQLLHASGQNNDWTIFSASSLPAQEIRPGFLPVAQNALQQLQYLQEILEQTNAELVKIEQMIHHALNDMQQP